MMWTESSQETLFRGKTTRPRGFLDSASSAFCAAQQVSGPGVVKSTSVTKTQSIYVYQVLFAAKFDAPLRKISVESMIIWSSNSGILPNLWSVMLVGKVQTLFPAIHFTPCPYRACRQYSTPDRNLGEVLGPSFFQLQKKMAPFICPDPTSQLHPLKKKNIIHQKYYTNESGDWFLICVLFWFGAFWLESNSGWGCIHFPRRPQVLKWGSKPC